MNKKMEELKSKSEKELKKILAEKREALRDFRFSSRGTQIRTTKLGASLRKDIARILFLLGVPQKGDKTEETK
jgi:ribosomal protein L29